MANRYVEVRMARLATMQQWTGTEGARDNQQYPLLHRFHQGQTEYLSLNSGDRVLDIGCGRNPIDTNVASVKTFAIDPDWNLISEAKNKIRAGEICCGLGHKLPFDSERFDTVFMRGVVHHLDSTQRRDTFEEIKRVLRSDGELIVLEPDPESTYRKLVWSIAGLFGYEHEESPHVETSGYVTKRDITDLCEHASLSIREQGGDGGLLAPFGFIYPFHWGIDFFEYVNWRLPVDWWSLTIAVPE